MDPQVYNLQVIVHSDSQSAVVCTDSHTMKDHFPAYGQVSFRKVGYVQQVSEVMVVVKSEEIILQSGAPWITPEPL